MNELSIDESVDNPMARDPMEKEEKKEDEAPGGLAGFMDGPIYGVFIALLTLWSLLFDDVRLVWMSKDSDSAVGIGMIFVFLVFLAEICINFAIKRDYGGENGWNFLTVFFLVDAIGTISLLPDILFLLDVISWNASALHVARAGRAARLGSRISLLIRTMGADDVSAHACPISSARCRTSSNSPTAARPNLVALVRIGRPSVRYVTSLLDRSKDLPEAHCGMR